MLLDIERNFRWHFFDPGVPGTCLGLFSAASDDLALQRELCGSQRRSAYAIIMVNVASRLRPEPRRAVALYCASLAEGAEVPR